MSIYDDVAAEAFRDGSYRDARDEARADAAAMRRELESEAESLRRQGDEAAYIAATWGLQ